MNTEISDFSSLKEADDLCQNNEKYLEIDKTELTCGYLKWLKNVYLSEEQNVKVSDADSVYQWVSKCTEMQNPPIISYRQENIGFDDENFFLVIMTDLQKKVLASCSKNIICVDTFISKTDPILFVISVIDDLNEAFPAAYCITNNFNKTVIKEFFMCIKICIGTINAKYFKSSYNELIYECWREVMDYSPKWLWNQWAILSAMKAHLLFFQNETFDSFNGSNLFSQFKAMLKNPDEDEFKLQCHTFFTEMKEELRNRLEYVELHSEKWATCYRSEISCSFFNQLELLHTIFITCSKFREEIFKMKRLYFYINVLMRILKAKCIDRVLRQISLELKTLTSIKNAINILHNEGMNIHYKDIYSLSDTLWKIVSSAGIEYVNREVDKCFVSDSGCNLICKHCNTCIHQYACSCMNNVIHGSFCEHIHAVAFKLTRYSIPIVPAFPTANTFEKLQSEEDYICSDTLKLLHNTKTYKTPIFRCIRGQRYRKSRRYRSILWPFEENYIPESSIREESEVSTLQSNAGSQFKPHTAPFTYTCLQNVSENNSVSVSQGISEKSSSPVPQNISVFNSYSPVLEHVSENSYSSFSQNVSENSSVPENIQLLKDDLQCSTNIEQSVISNDELNEAVASIPLLVDHRNLIKKKHNLDLLDRALLKTVELYQSMQKHDLEKDSLNEISKHLNACLNAVNKECKQFAKIKPK